MTSLIVEKDKFLWEFETLVACPICQAPAFGSHFEERRSGVELQFQRCKACSLVFQNPRPSHACLQRYFNSSLFIGQEGASPREDSLGYYDYLAWETCYRKNAVPILRRLKAFNPMSTKLLEIGVGSGWFMREAKEYGYEVSGIDVSDSFLKLAESRYDVCVKKGSIEEINSADNTFDIICNFGGIACWEDPLKALSNIRRMLKENGTFCFNYSNLDSFIARLWGRRFFEYNHASLFLYTKGVIHGLLKANGFRILSDRIQNQYASVKRILSYLKLNGAYHLAEKWGIEKLTFRIPVFSTRLVFCQKYEGKD